MSLAKAIEHVFGMPAGQLVDPHAIKWRALEFNPASWNMDESDCSHWIALLDREDVIVSAIGQGLHTPTIADLCHLFLDAVLAAIPYRAECFVVEIEAPHRLWYYSEGFRLVANDFFNDTPRSPVVEPPDDVFRARFLRARWTYYLFPNGATWIETKDVVAAWRADGAPTAKAMIEVWERGARGCGDTLGAVWGAYFTGANDEVLGPVLDIAAKHGAAAVRSSAQLVRDLDSGVATEMHDEIRKRRARFLDAIKG
jgi:hypothetical protein